VTRLLVTGASGFAAGWFFELFRGETGFELAGFSRTGGHPLASRWFHGDIRNYEQVVRMIGEFQPELVLHLAACADPTTPELLIDTNVGGTWNLLSACARLQHSCAVLLVGSAASFGHMLPTESGLSATRAARPDTIYGCSRQWQLEVGALFESLRVLQCRPFNIIGPGLPDRYAATAIALRMLRQENGTNFSVRNAAAVRDLIDVRDVVQAFRRILLSGKCLYPYSIGTGLGTSVLQLADELAEICGRQVRIQESAGESGQDRSAGLRSVADSADLQADTGWAPQISRKQSLTELVARLQKT
jgi:nucleoside-diphosphate-sugar epimerase